MNSKNNCPSYRPVRILESLFNRFYLSLHQCIPRITVRLIGLFTVGHTISKISDFFKNKFSKGRSTVNSL